MKDKSTFINCFNDAVEEFNDVVCGNIMLQIEADYDPYYEYRAIEIAVDDNDYLVVGGAKTQISVVKDISAVACHYKTFFQLNYYGSYINISLTNGDYIKLVYDNPYDSSLKLRKNGGLYVLTGFELESVSTNEHEYVSGMTRDIFIHEYNNVVEAFNARSSDYSFEIIEDESDFEEDDDILCDLAIDSNNHLCALGSKTKISVYDIRKISYRTHSEEDKSYITFVLLNGKKVYFASDGIVL